MTATPSDDFIAFICAFTPISTTTGSKIHLLRREGSIKTILRREDGTGLRDRRGITGLSLISGAFSARKKG